MNYAKRVRLCCIVFAALTVLVLRTAVAQAATLQSSAVGNVAESATSAHAETNLPLNGAVAVPVGSDRGLFTPDYRSTLSSVASPNAALPNEALYGVAAISSKDVWAVGYSLVSSTSPYQTLTEHWNGVAWSVVASRNVGPFNNFFYGLAAIASNNVWAVGGYQQSKNSPDQTLIEHWNGTSWSVVTSPNVGTSDNFFNGVVAISSNDVWAVGDYHKTSTSPYQTLTEHWNGTSWSVVTSPNVGTSTNYLQGVEAIASNNVWAMGYAFKNTTSPAQTLAEHWNGTSWSVVTSPNVGAFNNFFSRVEAVSSNDVWAMGGYYTSNSSNAPEQTLTEHWNGTVWSVVSSPNFGGANTANQLWGVAAIVTNDVWSVGDNVTSSTNFQAFTEHWNGKSWSIIPPG